MTAQTITAQAGLAAAINQEHKHAVGKARDALEHARRVGELLLQAKAAIGHGGWLPWIEANLTFSTRTVSGYMRVVSCWSALTSKSATVADLPLRGALALIAKPKDRGSRARREMVQLEDVKIMPPGYWRDRPEFQPQFLASLVDAWQEASEDTRRQFFLVVHARDEFMPVVDAATVKETV